jgi:uncharacterized protein (DUF342 family)
MSDAEYNKEQEADIQFSLRATDDKLAVRLTCQSDAVLSSSFAEELKTRLRQMGLTAFYEEEILSGLRAHVEAGGEVVDYPIIQGVPPTPPKDGRLEWTDDYFAPGYYIDPITKRIDFHQKVEKRSVQKDQLLVRIIPHEEGRDGQDIYGLPIKVPRAKRADLRGGPHVTWDGQEKGYRALCAGRVRLVGDLLDVDEVLHIRGDVGKETGNISHNGQLIIDGNVESDFKIEASGDIEVRGLIYAAEVVCGGNLIAREGINENAAKKISVRGDIISKYILNATIECSGSINLKKEIFQSNVKCCGEINCSEGRIVGGEIFAARGITVGEAGSKGNVKTSLVVGVDCALLNEIKNHSDMIEKQKEALRKLTPVYKKLKTSLAGLTPAQKEGMTEINFKIVEAEEDIRDREEKSKEIRKKLFANREAQIIILQTVHPGAALRVADTQTGVSETLLGPIVVRQDKISRQLVFSSELAKKVGKVT